MKPLEPRARIADPGKKRTMKAAKAVYGSGRTIRAGVRPAIILFAFLLLACSTASGQSPVALPAMRSGVVDQADDLAGGRSQSRATGTEVTIEEPLP